MLKFIKNSVFVAGVMFITSCSPSLTGNWNVKRFETGTPGQQGVAMTNIGTMTFKRNGTGEKNLNYTILGILKNDNVDFTWEKKDNKFISIKSDGSELSKTWIVITNKNKSQVWKSTDGSNSVQTIELSK